MEITRFRISSDKSKLELTIIDAANVESLTLWTDSTYKDFSKAINLNSKLSGSSTENIDISLSDLNLNFFDGIYFIEAETQTQVSFQYAYQLLKYYECLIDKVRVLEKMEECSYKDTVNIVNIQSVLKALEYSLQQGFLNESLKFIKVLNKFCMEDCKTCGQTLLEDKTYEIFNPDNIIINIDGEDA